jgi:uncharacterized protein YbdZ (MbtH family)
MSNDEGQHSLWPSFVKVPAGWTKVYGEDTRQAWLEFIEQNRTDLRPKSPRTVAAVVRKGQQDHLDQRAQLGWTT